jgi:hypothetical protein
VQASSRFSLGVIQLTDFCPAQTHTFCTATTAHLHAPKGALQQARAGRTLLLLDGGGCRRLEAGAANAAAGFAVRAAFAAVALHTGAPARTAGQSSHCYSGMSVTCNTDAQTCNTDCKLTYLLQHSRRSGQGLPLFSLPHVFAAGGTCTW